jgi:hypothetical protein
MGIMNAPQRIYLGTRAVTEVEHVSQEMIKMANTINDLIQVVIEQDAIIKSLSTSVFEMDELKSTIRKEISLGEEGKVMTAIQKWLSKPKDK